jgi:hypothetical protein
MSSELDTSSTPPPTPEALVSERRRLLTAFALTPFLSGFYPAVFLAEPAIMPLGLLVAYVSAGILGVPLVFYCSRRGLRDWWMYVGGGAACALPSIALYAVAPLPGYLEPFGALPVVELLLWGASSGLLFWMIGVAGDSAVSLRTLFDPISSRK